MKRLFKRKGYGRPRNGWNSKLLFLCTLLASLIILSIIETGIGGNGSIFFVSSYAQKKQITLKALLVEPKDRWDSLIPAALLHLRAAHPDLDIKINYTVLPYDAARGQLLRAIANQTAVDLMSVDEIWLGDFAQRGYLVDLTDRTVNWGKSLDWYQVNWDGGAYNHRIYGIWAWTDVRSIWYWKDLLNKAGVDPNSLKTWDGYISSAKKLDDALNGEGIKGTFVYNTTYSQDLWYPYLWMLGGDILKLKTGHPTKGTYWFPAFNSSAGVRAMEFIKNQSGIKTAGGNVEKDFASKKYAFMLAGSWLPGEFSPTIKQNFEQQIGMIPMFPVPYRNTQNTTMMGGWELSVPETSKNKDLAWELITIMLKPEVLAPVLAKFGYLPTQVPIGEGPYSADLRKSIPYYDELVSMIPTGHARPNIPEYPLIANEINDAINKVYLGAEQPKQALDEAAAKSAKALGWP